MNPDTAKAASGVPPKPIRLRITLDVRPDHVVIEDPDDTIGWFDAITGLDLTTASPSYPPVRCLDRLAIGIAINPPALRVCGISQVALSDAARRMTLAIAAVINNVAGQGATSP
jgi:hypothetical protein